MALGLSAASTDEMKKSIRRKVFVGIIIGTLLVVVQLAITSYKVAKQSHLEYQAQEIALKWLDQSGFDLTKLKVMKDHLDLFITGSGELPPLSDFVTELNSKINADLQVRLEVISSQLEFYPE